MIKRYSYEYDHNYRLRLIECPQGVYVKYDDHESIVKTLKEIIDRLDRRVCDLESDLSTTMAYLDDYK